MLEEANFEFLTNYYPFEDGQCFIEQQHLFYKEASVKEKLIDCEPINQNFTLCFLKYSKHIELP